MEIKELLKNKKMVHAIILGLIAVMTIVLTSGFFGNGNNKSPPEYKKENSQNAANDIEARLENILSTIKGAGKVSVFVMLEDLGVTDYVKDTKEVVKDKQNENEEKTVLSGGSSESIPVVARTLTPKVKGVIVTAEGAGDPQVKEKIKEAVETALGVMPHRVEVTQRGNAAK